MNLFTLISKMRQVEIRKYFAAFIGLLLACTVIYLYLFFYSIGKYTPSEWWIRDFYAYKKYRAHSMDGPRILALGGSSIMYGINSETIHKKTGYPTVNMGTHALLPLQFHFQILKNLVQEGDIVFMPLEFSNYRRKKDSAWFYHNMVSWGNRLYISQLQPLALIEFIFGTPKSQLYQHFLYPSKSVPGFNLERMVARVAKAQPAEIKNPYAGNSLNINGDVNIPRAPIKALVPLYLKGSKKIVSKSTDRFYRDLKLIANLINKRHATLILAWPVTLRNKKLDFSFPLHQSWAQALRSDLKQHGVNIYCNPALYNLDLRFFLNSPAHLNAWGADLASANYADCINSALKEPEPEQLNFPVALEKLKQDETSYSLGIDPINDVPRHKSYRQSQQ